MYVHVRIAMGALIGTSKVIRKNVVSSMATFKDLLAKKLASQ